MITCNRYGNVVVVRTDPWISRGSGDPDLVAKLDDLVRNGHPNIVLDLGECTNLDTHGVAAVIDGFALVGRKKGRLKFANVEPGVERRLRMADLLADMEVFPSESAAIESMTSASITS
jgi:anti-anti-sigma regulatory factor